ncbi:phosphoglycerate mutase [Lysobacteraceae bacterium NML93-0399]|nr:phosphoglycerate mutase [Xanthomonadaceae bacterium NML93-0399]
MTSVVLLLPAPARFGAQRWQPDVARAFGRADVVAHASGRRAQLARHVALPGDSWPLAALSRQVDVGDAAVDGAAWLRADPAWLRPDINGVRLMGHGDTLGLTQADVDALLPALQPVFADAGFVLDAPSPARWYLRLPGDVRVPMFPDPSDALGTDLADHDEDAGPEARRWRALGTEAQVLLHNHSWNARRLASGLPPVNALWFWGGGVLPAVAGVAAASTQTYTGDATLHALAAQSGTVEALPDALPALRAGALFDLVGLRDLRQLQQDWLRPALDALADGRIATLVIDDEAGEVRTLRRRHRLRVWRRAWAPHAATDA